MRKLATLGLIALVAISMTGCVSSRYGAIDMVEEHVEAIETIAIDRSLNLDYYEGIALFQMGKVGIWGLGAVGGTATIYLRDETTKAFGPPTFVGLGGPSIGIGYAGVNVVDCLLLFRRREAAIKFAERGGMVNFTHEAAFATAGRKAMKVPGAKSFSDGAGLCLGFIELEFLMGGPKEELHEDIYEVDTSVEKILLGEAGVPDDLKDALNRLNVLAK
jgi:lipid-binding SYLF domain-containing protein